MTSDRLATKVEQALRRLGVPPGAGMVVAVSGGPDSVALLRALLAQPGSARYVVAHLNHQLRGAKSDADEQFVSDLVTALANRAPHALAVSTVRRDVRRLAGEEHGNLEDVARRVRYDWLRQIALQHRIPWIATGHTADDQAETVLHRLLRGAGLKGLRGIAPSRELAPGLHLIRPLLAVSRREVLACLQAEQQSYRDDRSNLDPAFTRNRIRHDLLPQLAEQYNPEVGSILCRLAEQAEDAFAVIEAAAQALLQEVEKPRAGTLIVLQRPRLAAAAPYLVCELFRAIWEREGWSQQGMRYEHWQRLAAVAQGELPALDLPGGIRARAREQVVQVGPAP